MPLENYKCHSKARVPRVYGARWPFILLLSIFLSDGYFMFKKWFKNSPDRFGTKIDQL